MLDSCEIGEIFYCLSWKIKYFFNTIRNYTFLVNFYYLLRYQDIENFPTYFNLFSRLQDIENFPVQFYLFSVQIQSNNIDYRIEKIEVNKCPNNLYALHSMLSI